MRQGHRNARETAKNDSKKRSLKLARKAKKMSNPSDSKTTTKNPGIRKGFRFDPDLWDRVETYRFHNRIRTEQGAVEALIAIGLDASHPNRKTKRAA